MESLTSALTLAWTQEQVAQLVVEAGLRVTGATASVLVWPGAHNPIAGAYAGDVPVAWIQFSAAESGPAATALTYQTSQYFEDATAVARTYPALIDEGVGAVAAVPLLSGAQPLGALVLIRTDAHAFTPGERAALSIVAGQGALALERAQLLASRLEHQTHNDALDAFARLTEAVGGNTEPDVLIDLAQAVLRITQPDLTVSCFELRGDRWFVQHILPTVPDGPRLALQHGLPADTPAFAQATVHGLPVFLDSWDADQQRVPGSETYFKCAFAPYFRAGQPVAMLNLASQVPGSWTSQQRSLFGAVWRVLGIALERAEQATQLERQEALDAFVAFAEQSTTVTDVYDLAQQAVRVLRTTLGDVSAAYFDLDGDMWHVRAWSEDFTPEILTVLHAGIPADAPSYARARHSREPVFVAEWDANREHVAQTEAYGAGAFFACSVGSEVHGLLAMGTQRTSDWSERDRAVFQAVGRSLTLALERSAQARALEEERAALAAFARFTETSSDATDALTLAANARDVLRSVLGDVHVTYYELTPHGWAAQLLSGELEGDLPVFMPPFHEGHPVFLDGQDGPHSSGTPHDTAAALALYPYSRRGEPHALLSAWQPQRRAWSERERNVFLSVGRSLYLGFERLEQTAQLAAQNAELEARSRALEGFADLTRDLTLSDDPYLLTQRAQQVVLSLLPSGYALYFEPEGERWVRRAQTGELGSDALQAVAEAGLPYHDALNLLRPFTTLEPYYQDQYDKAADRLDDLVAHLGASATLPVMVAGHPVGVFAVVLFGERRVWTAADRAVLDSVVHALGLALERSQATRQLREERAALEAFTAFTEAAGTQTDVLALSRQAFDVLRTRFSDTSTAVYHEVIGDHFYARSWSEDIDGQDDLLATLQGGTPLTAPLFAEAMRTGEAAFTAHWNPEREQIAHTEAYGAAAVYPLRVGGQIHAFLSLGLRRQRTWMDRDAAVLQAVGRGLTLALERADLAEQLRRHNLDLGRANRELLSANEELEAFAYSASHDLRTPVRHVKGFSELTRRALHRGNIESALAHLHVIETASERMSAMIDALLQLARSAGAPLSPGPVDLGRLVVTAQQDVAAEVVGRDIEWLVHPLPTVQGDAVTLQQVMTNFVSNAVKFTSTVPHTMIEVWAEQGLAEVTVYVRDNGVGFDARYASRLFGAFQRLHNEREFSGTGIGLATVRRIILRHGGQVHAEGHRGQGATFAFSLPHKPPPH